MRSKSQNNVQYWTIFFVCNYCLLLWHIIHRAFFWFVFISGDPIDKRNKTKKRKLAVITETFNRETDKIGWQHCGNKGPHVLTAATKTVSETGNESRQIVGERKKQKGKQKENNAHLVKMSEKRQIFFFVFKNDYFVPYCQFSISTFFCCNSVFKFELKHRLGLERDRERKNRFFPLTVTTIRKREREGTRTHTCGHVK